MNDDILYKPEEIAQKLKITKNTVYEMIKRGDLDAHRLGKHLRISEAQFEAYLQQSKGSENVYDGTILCENNEIFVVSNKTKIHVNTDLKGNVKFYIRPEDIILSKEPFLSSARNNYKGKVIKLITNESSVKIVLDIGLPLTSLITVQSLNDMNIAIDDELYAIFKTMAVRVYK
jgi:molybdate/tungstate transport system ATP-binding protein